MLHFQGSFRDEMYRAVGKEVTPPGAAQERSQVGQPGCQGAVSAVDGGHCAVALHTDRSRVQVEALIYADPAVVVHPAASQVQPGHAVLDEAELRPGSLHRASPQRSELGAGGEPSQVGQAPGHEPGDPEQHGNTGHEQRSRHVTTNSTQHLPRKLVPAACRHPAIVPAEVAVVTAPVTTTQTPSQNGQSARSCRQRPPDFQPLRGRPSAVWGAKCPLTFRGQCRFSLRDLSLRFSAGQVLCGGGVLLVQDTASCLLLSVLSAFSDAAVVQGLARSRLRGLGGVR
jgi:hypothetical protein